jgi:hypothetical protein
MRFVLEGESSEKSFPYLLSAQKLGRAVLVKNGVGVCVYYCRT